jgi:chemotaxis protein CheZ
MLPVAKPRQKTFRIERWTQDARKSAVVSKDGAGQGISDEMAEERHNEILMALAGLKKQVKQVSLADGQQAALPTPSIDPAVLEDYRKQIAEGERLKHDLKELHDAIAITKKEIAYLRAPSGDSDKIEAASHELSAVVMDTENATDKIITAAEAIEKLSEELRNSTTNEDEIGQLEEIGEYVVNVYEACNFQDITGQRITKVINTMMFIDEQVQKMMNVWGGEAAFAEIEIENEDALPVGDRLHGPAMPDAPISQDDIDALFD